MTKQPRVCHLVILLTGAFMLLLTSTASMADMVRCSASSPTGQSDADCASACKRFGGYSDGKRNYPCQYVNGSGTAYVCKCSN